MSTAMRSWSSATWRSKSRAIRDWPSSLMQFILDSTRLLRWYPLHHRQRAGPRHFEARRASLRATAPALAVRHRPVQPDQLQQALHEPGRLPQRHAKKHLHRQTSLDRFITEALLSTALATRARPPRHRWIEPDRQRFSSLQRFRYPGGLCPRRLDPLCGRSGEGHGRGRHVKKPD